VRAKWWHGFVVSVLKIRRDAEANMEATSDISGLYLSIIPKGMDAYPAARTSGFFWRTKFE
jgi:hypothetical protein